MEPETNKNKGFSKDETLCLLSLIEGSKIINKGAKATSNKLINEEWQRITIALNALMGTCRRSPQQLRLKWENLKINSRKRTTELRMERIKMGGESPDCLASDEILDRVAALLGCTGQGLTANIDGDVTQAIIGDGIVVDDSGQCKTGVKRRLTNADNGVWARNVAIAEYYNTKKKFLDCKLEQIMLENDKLKLEIKKLQEEDEP
ncbi:uncharacterized protein LOC123714489 [Pieris brassicae]|uniref:Regulatory protein zeste n=1 Tax=Pieris brassicae TaxID=7116 RepID=A0A9P0X2N6_PIEBR|nr:uncharacterized protein LOC123714489 [Pieris brassicae]CAH3960763.1 unnamed protein product [Pieris brassicae]